MKTVILPGYSPHNKDWAEYTKSKLHLGHEIIVHNWLHWTKGSFSLPREVDSLLKKFGKEKINIVAKSVGTRVAMHIIAKNPNQMNKLILCGIPTKVESKVAKKIYTSGLSLLSPSQVIIFQNTNDPFASFSIIEKFIHLINPKIKVIEKTRSDHQYPYPEDFQEFLVDKEG